MSPSLGQRDMGLTIVSLGQWDIGLTVVFLGQWDMDSETAA